MASVAEVKAAIDGMKAAVIEMSMNIGATAERAQEIVGLHAMVLAESSFEEAAQMQGILQQMMQKLEEVHDLGDQYGAIADQFSASL